MPRAWPSSSTPLTAKLQVGALGSLVLKRTMPALLPELAVAILRVKVAEPPTAMLAGNEPASAKPLGKTRLLRVRAEPKLELEIGPTLETVNVSWGAVLPGLTVPKSMGVVRPLLTYVLPWVTW